MFLFYVLSFFKKGETIQGGTLFKEIRYIRLELEFFISSKNFRTWEKGFSPVQFCSTSLFNLVQSWFSFADLSTVDKKVNNRDYTKLCEFSDDVMLICENWQFFNQPNSSISYLRTSWLSYWVGWKIGNFQKFASRCQWFRKTFGSHRCWLSCPLRTNMGIPSTEPAVTIFFSPSSF